MPDTPPSSSSRSRFGFLTKKIGPVPIWLIIVAIAAGYYWYEHFGPGAKASSASSGTDQVDPVTGESYASELGAAQQQISDLQAEEANENIPSGTGSTPPPKKPTPPPTREHDHDHDHDRDDRRRVATVARPRTAAAPAAAGNTRWRAAA